MELPNVDSNGIHFGYIKADSLDPEVIDGMQAVKSCEDLTLEDEMHTALFGIARDALSDLDAQDFAQEALALLLEYNIEPTHEATHEGVLDGVKYRTSWLGGALHVFILRSPHITRCRQCSMCVPNAGNLDQIDEDGIETYDVPKDWRAEHV